MTQNTPHNNLVTRILCIVIKEYYYISLFIDLYSSVVVSNIGDG